MQNNVMPVTLKSILLSMLLIGSVAHSQTFDNPDVDAETDIEATELEAPLAEEDQIQNAEPEPIIVDAGVIEQGDFNPFVPSEDISEDYSVPFPVDI